ncbi:MAG: PAQR family membrane homeostasis protein TrhA [Desulfovibrio sp.]
MEPVTKGRYTLAEEIANSITHGVGIIFSIAALAVMTSFASVYGNAWHVVSCSIYGSTLIIAYIASTLYHSIQHEGAKAVFRVLDHASIFLLIAGTYTPFTLVNLRGPWGWSLLSSIWFLAILGIIIQATKMRKNRKLSISLCIIMGWIVVIAAKPMIASVDMQGLILLLLGGLMYTGGIVFYLCKRIPYNHAIWHIFVLAGSVLHFLSVLFYVIPYSASA